MEHNYAAVKRAASMCSIRPPASSTARESRDPCHVHLVVVPQDVHNLSEAIAELAPRMPPDAPGCPRMPPDAKDEAAFAATHVAPKRSAAHRTDRAPGRKPENPVVNQPNLL